MNIQMQTVGAFSAPLVAITKINFLHKTLSHHSNSARN